MLTLELVQCTVQLEQKGHRNLTTIVKSGPDAVTVPELVLLYQQHSIDLSEEGCAISDAVVVGTVETTKDAELDRLRRKGFPADLIERNFPGGRMMPKTLYEADLPKSAIGKPLRTANPDKAAEPARAPELDRSPAAVSARKKALRDAITAAGVAVPTGNLTEADLQAIADEHGIKALETT